MAFHDVTLPSGIQYASQSGPGFATIIQTTASGHEVRVARQAQAVHRLSLVKALQTPAEAKELKSFALERRGALHSFKVIDFADYTSNSDGETAPAALDQVLGTGDGTTTQFQLVKRYGASGPSEYTRTITLPVSGSVLVAVAGTPTTSFTVNSAGVVTLASAPTLGQIVTAGYQFSVPVRFSLDFDRWARLQADAFQNWSLPLLDLQEVLNEVEQPERVDPGGCFSVTTSQDVTISYADGRLINIVPGAAINAFLPVPGEMGSGIDVFVINNATGSAGTVQVRDDAGNALGTAISAGIARRINLVRSGSTSTWVMTS
jgi:uncharacterized protein (TIGR02217 family)